MHWGNISDRLVEALINGGYQGLLLVGCTALIIKSLPRSNAATRHAILFVALLISASLPILHFVFPKVPAGSVVSLGTWAKGESATDLVVLQEVEVKVEPLTKGSEAVVSATEITMADPITEETVQTEATWIIDEKILNFSTALPVTAVEPSAMAIAPALLEEAAKSEPIKEWIEKVVTFVKASLPGSSSISIVVLMVLLTAALGRSINLVFQYVQLRRLKEVAGSASEAGVALFEELKDELGISRKARLLVHPVLGSPMAMGFRKPAVILPQEMEATASEQQLEQLLRHELAHLKRFDDWTNLVQQLIKEIYCFHPGILWLSKRLTIEREIACDDQVLAAAEGRSDYALFLTEFASRRTSREWAAAQAAWSNRSQLRERIDMILDSKRNTTPGVARTRTVATGAFAALLAALALTSAPRLAFAQSPTPTPAEADTKKNEDSTPTPQGKSVEVKEDVLIYVDPSELKEEEIILESPGEESGDKLILRGPKKVQRGERRIVTARDASVRFEPGPAPAIAQVRPVTPARAPGAMAEGKNDVDGRLERLEKMMEQLLARESGKKEKDVIMRFENPDPRLWEKRVEVFDSQKLREEVDRATKSLHGLPDIEKMQRSIKDQATTIERKKMSAAAEKEALRAHQQSLQQQLHAIQARLDSLEQKENAEKQQLKAKAESLRAAQKETAKKSEANADKVKSTDQERGATVSVDGQLDEARSKLQKMLLEFSEKHPAVIAQRDLITKLEQQQNHASDQQDEEKANDPSAEKF